MNLDRPSSADLGQAALLPVVLALLKAYLADGQYAACVEFSSGTEKILGANAEARRLRQNCQDKLPNKRLLPGGGGL